MLREHGRKHFSFLVSEAGFNGPETTADGLAYSRPGLRVELWYVGGREAEVVTWLSCDSPDGRPMSADLHCLYVACGCGPPNALPGTVSNVHTTIKRVEQHAAALRKVLPFMTPADTENLIRSCHRRQLPDDWRRATHRPRPGPLAGY